MRVKKIPVRMCVGCGEHKNKSELVRVVKSPQGEISLDFTGKAAGRGAYICKNAECLTKAQKARRLEIVFKMQFDKSVYDGLFEELNNAE